jgi:receptor expression-enhancing protein 5/6
VDEQYWIVYAFLTVLESLVNAVYWFPFYYTFKFVFIMYMALPQTQYGSPLHHTAHLLLILTTIYSQIGAPKSSSAP